MGLGRQRKRHRTDGDNRSLQQGSLVAEAAVRHASAGLELVPDELVQVEEKHLWSGMMAGAGSLQVAAAGRVVQARRRRAVRWA